MATFEKRVDSSGRVRSIRVKVRLAGLPHLSKTVRLEGDSPEDIARAMALAQAWAAETSRSVEQDVQLALGQPDVAGVPSQSVGSKLAAAWTEALEATQAELAVERARALGSVRDAAISSTDALVLTLASVGLRFDEMAALRWRHVRLEAGLLDVPGETGYVSRQVPLTSALRTALWGLGQAKRGLVLGLAPLELAERYRALTVREVVTNLARLGLEA